MVEWWQEWWLEDKHCIPAPENDESTNFIYLKNKLLEFFWYDSGFNVKRLLVQQRNARAATSTAEIVSQNKLANQVTAFYYWKKYLHTEEYKTRYTSARQLLYI